MSDPFEQLLESALSGPDLELGHESRRRLLAAAARPVSETGNIVRFTVPDPDAESGFAWLAGESPVTRPLARRMTSDGGFLRMLDDERRFLRSLRSSLRQPPACPAAGPPSRRGWIAACAAALVAAAGAWWFSMPVARPGASSTEVASARPDAGLEPRSAVPAITAARAVESGPSGVAQPVSEKPLLGVDSVPLFAGVETPEPATTAEDSFPPFRLETLAVRQELPLIAALESPSPELLGSRVGLWQPDRMLDGAYTTVPTLATSLGDGRSNIPEPSSLLLMMTGSLLAWHRRRPRNPPASDPTR